MKKISKSLDAETAAKKARIDAMAPNLAPQSRQSGQSVQRSAAPAKAKKPKPPKKLSAAKQAQIDSLNRIAARVYKQMPKGANRSRVESVRYEVPSSQQRLILIMNQMLKNPKVRILNDEANYPMCFYSVGVINAMCAYVEECVSTQAIMYDSADFSSFKDNHRKIRNASGLELLFHYHVFMQDKPELGDSFKELYRSTYIDDDDNGDDDDCKCHDDADGDTMPSQATQQEDEISVLAPQTILEPIVDNIVARPAIKAREGEDFNYARYLNQRKPVLLIDGKPISLCSNPEYVKQKELEAEMEYMNTTKAWERRLDYFSAKWLEVLDEERNLERKALEATSDDNERKMRGRSVEDAIVISED